MIADEHTRVTLLRRKAVEAQTGLPRSSLYALIAKGDFPAGVKLTDKAVGWPSNLVDAWVSSRIAASAAAKAA